MIWLQRYRIDWLKEGDRNTKFFHQKAVWRARRNKISKLCDADGVTKTVPTDMQLMDVSYFKSLYTRDPTLDPSAITSLLSEQVSRETNEDLCKAFTDEDI
jgi:hypothetical protein